MSIKDKPFRASARAQPLKKAWWKSHWVWFPSALIIFWSLGLGIPWYRAMAISIPTLDNSQVAIGKFVSGQSKGYFGIPLVLQTDTGQILVFSCGAPEFRSTNATCFNKQINYLGKSLKVFWSHQASGSSSGTVMRPTQVEILDGEVIFSRAEALQLLNVQQNSYKGSVLVFLLVIGILYFPLMLLLDWMERREAEIKLDLSKE